MTPLLSIIIPNYNGSRTIGACLDAVFAHKDDACEVIVVDDCSDDASRRIIGRYPCRLISLGSRLGAAAARNAGAFSSAGEVLFFIDSDCLLKEDTISAVRQWIYQAQPGTIVGGTYTPRPQDPGFFSFFQSVFVNYFESKNCESPDYIATHAMVIHAETFRRSGGFREDFLPILEDVEFSHRLRAAGHTLRMDPGLQVRHIFNFSAKRSLRNAVRKTEYWFAYSLMNRNLFVDSGTASHEIKTTGVLWLASAVVALASLLFDPTLAFLLPVLAGAGVIANRHLFKAFSLAGGRMFTAQAALYHLYLYPAAVWTGTVRGLLHYVRISRTKKAARAEGK